MNLGDLITRLEAADPAQVVRHGFTHPHSYRGDYMDLAFEAATDVPVAAMLAAARTALGATFQGYKGGEFTMGEHTWCWLSAEGDASGETISALLLDLMLAPAVPAGQAPATDGECAASTSGSCLAEGQSETACDTDAGECVHGGKPATGQAALRDRIAAAILARIKWATVSKDQPADALTSLLAANEFDLADAVLKVLPAPVDRATVLEVAASHLEARAAEFTAAARKDPLAFVKGATEARYRTADCWDAAAAELRHLAASATEPQPKEA